MKITIPTSLQEITINQWLKFQKTVKPDMDTDIISIHLVSIFCNLSLEDTLKISAKDFKDIVKTVTETVNSKPNFKQRFTFNGVEYGMIPNLDMMSAGEYIDMDKYYSTDVLKFMSVLFRPITNKVFNTYQIETYKGSNNDLLESPIENYLGANVFFYNLRNELLNATSHYFQQLKQQDKEALEEVLIKNGGGINQFTQLLTETFTTLTKQPN